MHPVSGGCGGSGGDGVDGGVALSVCHVTLTELTNDKRLARDE